MIGMTAQPPSSRQAVYSEIRRRIVTLLYPPGTPLSENELAADLGVSRTPVREGLILLAQEGLVQVFPKVGSFVSRVDPRRLADAQFLREAVELAAIEAVPADPAPDRVAALRENVARQRAEQPRAEDFVRLDEEFHRGLLALSGHAEVWTTVQGAKAHLDRARLLGPQGTESVVFADQHAAVLDALLAGDRGGARETLRAHLRTVFDDIERVRRRSPELFASNDTGVPVRRSVTVWE
jgi:DNA-binding GntR family transcriptional regulator